MDKNQEKDNVQVLADFISSIHSNWKKTTGKQENKCVFINALHKHIIWAQGEQSEVGFRSVPPAEK